MNFIYPRLCHKGPWTWFETESAQHVKGQFYHFYEGFQVFVRDFNYGWDLGPSLPTRDTATIESVDTPRLSAFQGSQGKVMASIVWAAGGVLLVDYLDKDHTITGAYYADFLRQLRMKTKQIRRGELTRGVLFHQDNAPAHTSTVAMAAIQKCGFQLVEHPPCSPDLAPSENEKGGRWSSFCHIWWWYECCGPLSEGPKWRLLHRRDKSWLSELM